MGTVSLIDAGRPLFILSHRGEESRRLLVTD